MAADRISIWYPTLLLLTPCLVVCAGGGYLMRKERLSERVQVLCVESDELMGLPVLRELTSQPVQVVHIDGMHLAAMDRILKGEEARETARRLEAFLME